jgi:hypothetical protein
MALPSFAILAAITTAAAATAVASAATTDLRMKEFRGFKVQG